MLKLFYYSVNFHLQIINFISTRLSTFYRNRYNKGIFMLYKKLIIQLCIKKKKEKCIHTKIKNCHNYYGVNILNFSDLYYLE